MRTLQELIDTNDSAWPMIKQWIAESPKQVTTLSKNTQEIANNALTALQLTTKSTLGALIYESGGLLIDNGWIKVLGGGHNDQMLDILTWNQGKTIMDNNTNKGFIIVAFDVLGGYFCINSGALGKDIGKIYYFAPDTLDYEALEIGYSQLLNFFLTGRTEQFYQDFRWTNWQEQIASLQYNQVINFVPPLWTKEGKDIEQSAKKAVNVTEQFLLQSEFREGLNDIENKYI